MWLWEKGGRMSRRKELDKLLYDIFSKRQQPAIKRYLKGSGLDKDRVWEINNYIRLLKENHDF